MTSMNHDNAIAPSAAVISDFNSWHPYCVGSPLVAFIPAVVCVPAVVSGHDIAAILAVACC
jgi:hypothetical protein